MIAFLSVDGRVDIAMRIRAEVIIVVLRLQGRIF